MAAQSGLEMLKLQKARGLLIDKTTVELFVFSLLRQVRDKFAESKDFIIQALEIYMVPGYDLKAVESVIDKEYDRILLNINEALREGTIPDEN